MTRTSTRADAAVQKIMQRQGDLITRSQALAAGLTKDALRHRIGPGGRWRIVLPGVYLAHPGTPNAAQREIAAVLYTRRACVLTGLAAVARHGIRGPLPEVIDVLIPVAATRQSAGFVRVHKTGRMPQRPWVIGGIRWAPPARAIADAARGPMDPREVQAMVADAVQHGTCTVAHLAAELQAGPKQGSAALRSALADVAVGVRSVVEGDLRKLIRNAGLPEPIYNPDLYLGSEFLARPDAYWPDAGVACEVDSREWHISPAHWEATLDRHSRMEARGVHVLHFTPRRLRARPAEVASLLRSALEAGRDRPRLAVRAVPGNARLGTCTAGADARA